MTTPLARARNSQQRAADPAQSVFVTANAGSGKTKVLVDRIARLLLAGAAPSAFLCITFTKAAAAEMQRRLFDRLGAWCVMDDAALTAQFADLGEPPPGPKKLAEARALFAQALETPGGLRIQTIHGFCERLIARFPLEAGVAPGFEIAEDVRAAALIAQAWAETVARGDRDLEAALDRLGARFDAQTFDDLRAALAAQRGALRAFVAAKGDVARARAAVAERHGASATPEAIVVAALAGVDWALLKSAEAVLRESGGQDGTGADRIAAARAAPSLEALLEIFLTQKGEPRKAMAKKAVLSRHPALFEALDHMGAALIAARERLLAAERAADASAALTLGHALAAAYQTAKARVGALDFEDLIDKASTLLGDAEAAPWVLYKLDGGLSHILIDEGQDTSPAQWRLIAPLQAEFFAGEGARAEQRTVFAVGDPKQSIYSFQGADPAHFLSEAQALSARATAAGRAFAAPALEMSFRSAPEVLRVVDATFDGLDLADGPQGGDVVRHDPFRETHAGLVEWWPLAPRPVREEPDAWSAPHDNDRESTAAARLCAALAERVTGWIADGEAVWDAETKTERPMRPGDVLALVRSRGPLFQQLLKAMKRAGLPVAGADRMVLAREIAVLDLLCAARVALDPGDDLSLATLLKSPWIGLVDDDADIFPLAHGRSEGERLIDRLRADRAPRTAPARAFVDDLVAHAGLHPHAFLSRILDRVDAHGVSGWEAMVARLGHEARDPAEELLSRALAAGRRGPTTLHHFIHAIVSDDAQVKRETAQAEDAVRVMTVHGAKGLEAPVVLLADTTGPVSTRMSGHLTMTAHGPLIPGPDGANDAVVREALAATTRAALLEHRRLLYVAMTRARDRLIVCGPTRGNSNEGAAADSWWGAVRDGMARAGATPCETPFGEGLALGAASRVRGAGASKAVAAALPAWARTPAPLDGAPSASLAPSRLTGGDGPVLSPRRSSQGRFRRGALIHGLLQRLPDVPPPRRREAAARWLKARAVEEAEAAALIDEALGVIADPRFAAVFGPGSRAEAPIVATLAGGVVVRGAIDRMVAAPDGVLLLDYKTDRPPPARAEDAAPRILAQMAAYRAAVRLIFPGRPVRAALLWTDGPTLMDLPDALLDAQVLSAPAD
ncbi:MAG: double-strand break repair helicase AddA [Hyphomonadaceae bacterium]|nr:double-strand break repair helicase AddA [Hyphomonadaceae bacterium]